MRPLLTLSARWVALAAVVTLGIGLAGGAIRLLPWIVAPGVPWRLTVPFARLLAAAALESAMLIGLPVGVGLAAALFVERGEARALAGLGASPNRLLVPLVAAGLALGVGYAWLSSGAPPEAPGHLATRLVDAGRASCADRDSPGRVDVPLVGVTWLCFQGTTPRLAGRVPGLRTDLWFSAEQAHPTEELRSVTVRKVELAGRLGGRLVRVRAQVARVVGLPGWGAPRAISGLARSAVVVVSSLIVAWSGAWLLLRRQAVGPLAAGIVTGVSAVAMLAMVRAVDARSLDWRAYVAAPLAGVLVLFAGLAAAQVLASRGPRDRVAGEGTR